MIDADTVAIGDVYRATYEEHPELGVVEVIDTVFIQDGIACTRVVEMPSSWSNYRVEPGDHIDVALSRLHPYIGASDWKEDDGWRELA